MNEPSPATPEREARVSQYGCLAPVTGGDLVRQQMRSAAKYYNDLIALERTRRVVYRDLRREHVDLESLERNTEELAVELGELRTAIKAERQEARRRVVTAALNERAKEVHARLREARAALKEARVAAREDVGLRAAVTELDERAKTWGKALRATTDTYWGSYLLVEQSIEQARKAAVDPTFRRARGRERVSREGVGSAEGRIGVQIQGGMSVDELLGGQDTRLRLVDAGSRWVRGRTSVRGMRRCATKLLYIRVGSEGRTPIWAAFPLILHRPIPEGAVIKGATVSLRVWGHREHWTANITYVRDRVPMPQRPGVIALDLGWRQRPDASLRVAYWVDDQGRHGEITMPERIRAGLRKARDLQEIQDRYFNRAQRWLVRWLGARGDDIPDWLLRERATVSQWRSHERLRRLVFTWRDNRFAHDGGIFRPLERWLHRSRHLYQYQEGARRGALLHRREIYRITAAKLAREYGTVVIEQFDLTRAKRLKQPEEGEDAPRAQRAQLHASAPGELRQCITQAVQRDGGVVAALSAVGTTSHCHACGGVCAWDQGEQLWHTCEHCGVLWDQDRNAAINLLRQFCTHSDDAENGVLVRKPSKRAQRFSGRHADKSAINHNAD